MRARQEPRKLPHLHGQSSGIIDGVILRQLDESLSDMHGDVMLDDGKDVISLSEDGLGSWSRFMMWSICLLCAKLDFVTGESLEPLNDFRFGEFGANKSRPES